MKGADSSAPAHELPAPAEAMLRRMRAARYMTPSELRGRAKYLDFETLPSAMPTPSGERTNITRNHRSESTTRVIESKGADASPGAQYDEPVQHSFDFATQPQRDAFDTLREMNEPITVGDFADEHGCTPGTAARWLRFFCAKGVLVRRGNRPGHYFARGVK